MLCHVNICELVSPFKLMGR